MNGKPERIVSQPFFLAALALAGAATLSLEVGLVRLLAVVNWSQFSFFVISAGLLGFAASGTFVALAGAWGRRNALSLCAASCVLFSLAAPLAGRILMARPFNPVAFLWHWGELWRVAENHLSVALPFFAIGVAVAGALGCQDARKSLAYGANMIGSAAGAVGIVFAMYRLSPEKLPALAAIAGVFAALAFVASAGGSRSRRRAAISVAALAAAAQALWTPPLSILQYKTQPQLMQVKGATVLKKAFSPTGMTVAMENREIPPRIFTDLSLNYDGELPRQTVLIVDADRAEPLPADEAGDLVFDYTPQAAVYRLVDRPRALLLGQGWPERVRLARLHGARAVVAVEPQQTVLRLTRFFEPGLEGPATQLTHSTVRSAVEKLRGPFDLIQYGPAGSSAGSLAGAGALTEDYTLTVQAVQKMLAQLSPGGVLELSSWLRMPPRDFLKILTLAAQAAKGAGIEDLPAHVAALRGMWTGVVMISRRPLDKADCARVREFCLSRGFDLVYLPDMAETEANRFNLLDEPYYWQAAVELVNGRFLSYRWKDTFDLAAPTDSRPFFAKMLRWSSMTGRLPGDTLGVVRQQEIGDLLVLAVLAQAVAAFIALVLAPLALMRRGAPGRARMLLYFASTGMAYMAVEMAFIQKLTVILGSPTYSISAVLALLIGATGVGSLWTFRVKRPLEATKLSAVFIVAALIGLSLVDSRLISLAAPLAWPWPFAVAVLILVPLGLAMGLFFPIGLSRIPPGEIPWAWASNGCAAVAGTILSACAASTWGFPPVLAAAGALYLFAALILPSPALDSL